MFKLRAAVAAILLLPFASAVHAAQVQVVKEAGGWVMLVDGQPYEIRGVSYTPEKVGETPTLSSLRDWMVIDDNGNTQNDAAYDAYVDANLNNAQDGGELSVGDFALMRDMGINTIRLYHHASTASAVQAGYGSSTQTALQYNHAPNKTVLRDLYNTYGIRVAMGDFLGAYTIGSGAPFNTGTDYSNDTHKQRMLASVRQMVNDFKDEDFLLCYVLGNENNYSITSTNANKRPVEYARFVEEAVRLIHSLDPNHPVILCNGDTEFISTYVQYAPSVDIFGTNVYRSFGIKTLWGSTVVYDKPVVFTEYGDLNAEVTGIEINETRQKRIHLVNLFSMHANRRNGTGTGQSVGGFIYSWMDNWWQDGSQSSHNTGSNGVNNEFHGIMSQGNGSQSLRLRRKRTTYDAHQLLWRSTPTVMTASSGGQLISTTTFGQVTMAWTSGVVSGNANLMIHQYFEIPSAVSSPFSLRATDAGAFVSLQGGRVVQPFTITMQSSAPASLSTDFEKLVVAYYDARLDRWTALKTTRNAAAGTLSAQASFGGMFQIMEALPASSLSDVLVYPNPFRPSQGHTTLSLARMPAGSTVKIYSATGRLVRELAANASGIAVWDGRNEGGEEVASGVYHVLVSGGGAKGKTRIAIQR